MSETNEQREHEHTMDPEMTRQLESMAGMVIEGPDAVSFEYTVDREANYIVNYLDVMVSNKPTMDDARGELITFVLQRVWTILGQQVRLGGRTFPVSIPGVNPPSQSLQPNPYPEGTILVWRPGHQPGLFQDAEQQWCARCAYVLLPPFCKIVGQETR